MVRFSPMAIVACLLCVGIFYLTIDSPQASRLNAEDVAQKNAEITQAEQLARDLMDALQNQQSLNNKLTEADSRTIAVVESLQESIARLGEHVKDSVPTREEVTKLVSAKSIADDDVTCLQKVEQLQKELSELKARVDVLELTRATAAKTTASAAAASSYGSTSSPVVASSGGSTGSAVKSGGSTGSSVVRSSYGSTGSVNSTVRMDWQPVVQPQSYAPRWQNHDGLSRADHAAVYHGLNTSGMTSAQINAQLDADHDQHGPLHDGILASRTRSVTRSTYSPTSNCPGGVCPTGSAATTRAGGGLLGFGIFGRR